MVPMRKPVGVVLASDDSLVVVCDDGTVWTYVNHSDPDQRWQQKEPIPGTSAWEGPRPAAFR